MKRLLIAAAAAMLCLCANTGALAQSNEWAKGRLLVQTRAGLPSAELAKILKTHGGKARRIGSSDLHVVELEAGRSETAVQALLAHHPAFKFAELDRRAAPALVTNDPYLGSAWHLGKINAGQAWDVTQGSGITIAILDTGISGSHPDLIARLVPGWNFYDNNTDTSDVHGHGTAVAGAAAATSNNGAGVASVAGAAKLLPVRIADANAYAYWSTVAQGLTYAADQGARVANISYVGVAASASVQSAAQYMRSKGGLVVVAAGNNGINENIVPTTTMIPVSATDGADLLASWSSYGTFVALAAPGVGIWTTARSGGYESWSGTSLASPVTAGVVALMMAAKPTLANSQVESLLYSSSVDLGSAGRDIYFGYGRINAAAAVAAAQSAVTTDTTAPSAAISAPAALATVSGLVPINVTATDNVGVTRVELRVNGVLASTDLSAPYQFSWDSNKVANGSASLVATAFDAAGNSKASSSVSVNVANISALPADTVAPNVTISSPAAGAVVAGVVSVKLAASDDSGAAGITQSLYIDGALVSTGTGASLSYSWNTRKLAAGGHTVQAVARDAAGNSKSVTVSVTK